MKAAGCQQGQLSHLQPHGYDRGYGEYPEYITVGHLSIHSVKTGGRQGFDR